MMVGILALAWQAVDHEGRAEFDEARQVREKIRKMVAEQVKDGADPDGLTELLVAAGWNGWHVDSSGQLVSGGTDEVQGGA